MHDFSISQQIAHHVIRKVEEEKAKIEDRELTVDNKARLFLKFGSFYFVAAIENFRYLPLIGEEVDLAFPVKKGKIFDKENELALVS